ncbi:vomeronasal type-2 receptor 26 [Xenopus laevis]|uniref:Vomeronasal type-2 receptor 26 n=1 Tax=Xenopus laevis TaxID=8355 RepID=A0A8J0TIZ6_XENLA|nr:vomeronasal type-2 receptor 26 [Xenopus laevis]
MSSVVESSVVDHSFNSRTHLRRFEYNPCSTRRCRQFLVSHFLKYYRHYLAAIFAIEEINKDTNILPNITLGFHIYDTCSSERETVENVFGILTQKSDYVPNYKCNNKSTVGAFVGHLVYALSHAMYLLLGIYRFSQITYGTQDSSFNDRIHFPTLYKTMTSENAQDKVIIYLLKTFNWTWVGILSSDNGNHHIRNEKLKDQIINSGAACVEFFIVVNEKYFARHALHNMYMDSIGNRLDPSEFLATFMPWKIPHSSCSKNCPPGSRKILIKEKPICCYNCIQCSEGEVSTVSDMENCVKCPNIQWSNGQRDKCIMRTLDFLSFGDALGLSLACMAVFLSVLTTTVLIIFIKYKHTTIVKANNRELSYYLLISLIFSFLCSLLFIGWPMKGTCLIRQVVFAIVFTISISCVLGKTLTVVIAFSATRPGSKLRGWVGTRIPKCIVLLCTLVEIFICSLWLINSPPFLEYDTESHTTTMILQCNEGSTGAFYTVIGYIGLLALICLFVAYLSRELPDIFNEAQYITFSMLVFCSVWISFIPAYLSTNGKYLTSVEIFAILASGSGLLGLIFVPKCYIILLKPERNTRICLIQLKDK